MTYVHGIFQLGLMLNDAYLNNRTFICSTSILSVCLSIKSQQATADLYLNQYDPDACIDTSVESNPRTKIVLSDVPVIFYSPNYNRTNPEASNYPPNSLCQWRITITNQPVLKTQAHAMLVQ